VNVVKIFGDFVGCLETLDEFRYPRIKSIFQDLAIVATAFLAFRNKVLILILPMLQAYKFLDHAMQKKVTKVILSNDP